MTFTNTSTLSNFTHGIFVDTNNTLYAAAGTLQTIQIWTEGSLVPTRNLSTTSTQPHSILVTVDGDIYLDNGYLNHRVDKWTVNSSTPVTAMFVPDSCFGLFVDIQENLYCSIRSRHYVTRRSLMDPMNTTKIVAGNGTAGSALNQLNGSMGLVVDFNLNLYVADYHNNRILRFVRDQSFGTVVAGSGAPGTIDLYNPLGITLDGDGYLFISDYMTNRIVGSGPNGFRCLVACSGSGGSSATRLSFPSSFTFDRDGHLVIADYGNQRIQKFLLARNSCSE